MTHSFPTRRSSDLGTCLANRQDIYSVFTFDNTAGKYWTQMTVPERRASALNYGNVVFDGARATLDAGLTLDPRTAFTATAPVALAGEYEYGTASFGPAITPAKDRKSTRLNYSHSCASR